MSNDCVLWWYFSPAGMGDPPGGLVYVKPSVGEVRLHACYSRAQLRAVFLAAKGTLGSFRRQAISALADCALPEVSDVPESIVRGDVAKCILNKMTDGGTGGFRFRKEELAIFCNYAAGYDLVLHTEGDGTEALLIEFTVTTGCRVWVLPSRAATRRKLEEVRGFSTDEIYKESLRCLERSTLPEEDGERPIVRISGGLGDIITCVFFCLKIRSQRTS